MVEQIIQKNMRTNKFIIYIFLVMVSITFFSCEKDYEKIERVTYYPKFEVKGDATVILKKGSAFTDPGVIATEDGKELKIITTVSSLNGATSIDVNKVDIYYLTYSAQNSDGYYGTASRTVIVGGAGDLTKSLEGVYLGASSRPTQQFSGMKWIVVTEIAPKKYRISDAVGGYYDLGRKYGFGYAFQGAVITDTGSGYTVTTATAPSFGNTTVISNIVVDATAKTVKFTSTADFASNNIFTVVLTLDKDIN
jgi:hypothetical protein